ncbi:MAG: GNAT family N-acetyltransferase [Sulfitobacter sp.]|nr:GNAT family N-acetyltransferase [Sulfitobacter sp.]
MKRRIEVSTDIATCLRLRREVFIEEQGVSEADEIDDLDEQSLHLIAFVDDAPAGTARITIQRDIAKIGRVCVLRPYRGTGLGADLIRKALEVARGKATTAKLGAQVHALRFYERLGFVATGPVYDDAGIDHRDMVRDL